MHMINDKGEAVYFNPSISTMSVRTTKTTGWSRASAPPLSMGGTVSAAKAATSPRSSRLSATLPGMVSGPIDRHFFRRKKQQRRTPA